MSNMKEKFSRRKFIKNASLVSAGFFIVPRHVLGRGFIAPSDKLNIAGIGAGGKGESDLSEFSKSSKVNIVALVDVDDRQCKKSRERFPKQIITKISVRCWKKKRIILMHALFQHQIIRTPLRRWQRCN